MAVPGNTMDANGFSTATGGGYETGSYNAMMYNAAQARMHPQAGAAATVPGSTGAGIPPATPGGTVTNYGSNTQQQAGTNGPFAGLQGGLQSGASNLMSAGQDMLNTKYDQNGSIYNQQLQNERNQTNVNEAARGVTMSPYGAGVANQADIGFNSNWQNQLQQRQMNNISGAAQAMNPATGLFNQSYGSSTQGYNTQPPPPTPPPEPAALRFPNMPQQQAAPQQQQAGYNFPSQSGQTAASFNAPAQQQAGPAYQPSGQTEYSQITGMPTDTSPVINQAGVDYQTMMNPITPQEQMSPYQLVAAATGQPAYQDPGSVQQSQWGGANMNNMLQNAADSFSGGSVQSNATDNTYYSLMNSPAPSFSEVNNLLSNWSY